MGRRIFFGLSGGMGPVLRTLPIANLFSQTGDTVAFSIYDDNAAHTVRSRGYEHLPDDDPTMPDATRLVPRRPQFYHLDHYFAQIGLLDEKFVRSWIDHRIGMLQSFQADLVYADMSPHTVIAARYLGIPVVSITQSCFVPIGKQLHYWGDPPRNTPKVTPIINRVLTELGLPRIDRMEQLNEGDVTLIPGIPELDPVCGDRVYHIGPIEETVISNPSHPPSEPYILAYAGRLQDTSGGSGDRFVLWLAEAFRDKAERVLLAFGGDMDDTLKRSLPPSIQVVPSYSAEWLANCQLFIHHGGHGSCLSSIMAGVPSLIVPTHTEREFNARQMAELGLSEYMLPDTFLPENLYRLAKHVIEDEYRSRVIRLRDEIYRRNYRGAQEAHNLGRGLQMQKL
ncbi:glycosyltransferase [Cohnella soli]|uniref:Glycosyltransferase n=1 Tax=Cohnella soli TaxID=425005 RepID=A0ABW0I7U1_9BACL